MRKNSFLRLITTATSIPLVTLLFLKMDLEVSANEYVPNSIYQNVAKNFFEAQYDRRGIKYDDLKVILESDLYNSKNEVVAKSIVIDRDGEYDYVILNIATSQIDEFSFNDSAALDNFSQKVYYTGALNYYKKIGDSFLHFDKKTKISSVEFNSNSKRINQKYYETKNKSKLFTFDGNPIPVSNKNGWNGFYDWSNIRSFNSTNGYSNSDWGYLSGINCFDVTSLSFMSQEIFNLHFGTENACGPTALTNMFIWFDYTGIKNKNGIVNALKNKNVFDTFDRFRTLVKHHNDEGTARGYYNDALKTYAREQGYDYELDTGVDTFDEFKENIESDMPVLTSIDLDSWGSHAVLTVGFEKFEQSYEEKHSFMWWDWTTTEYRYSQYLRVIDGWDSSNSSRFIDCNGYWDNIIGRGFKLK